MKFLSTFKITKGFDTWLKMYKDIEPDLNELGIKILWAGTNSDETKVFDITLNQPARNILFIVSIEVFFSSFHLLWLSIIVSAPSINCFASAL